MTPDEQLADDTDRLIQDRHDSEIAVMPIPTRDHMSEVKVRFEGGATRSAKAERYDLIPPEAEEVEALRFGLGAVKHGDNNWKNGDAHFIAQTINHLRGHIVSLRKNGAFGDDDDIGAIRCNSAMLAWFRVHKPEEFRKAIEAGR